MTRLELQVPPDVVALVLAGLMWLVSAVSPSLPVPLLPRVLVAGVLLAKGVALIVAGRVAFARAGTTFSPGSPGRSSTLVTTSVYRFTRNPMYLGTLLVLFAVAVLLSNVFSLVLSAGYVVYIGRFQIMPEELVLSARFGALYDEYASRVPRWI